MSDLISRSKIRDYMKTQINHYGKPFEGTAYELGLKIMRYIDAMDSVYDIDKVVEELEENASRYTKKYVTPYGNNGYRYVKAISVNKAVEIVKHVGASDDVCEWEQSGDMAINPHTFSKYKIKQCAGVYALNTCPYCEKKIKVVELWRD